MKKLDKKNRGGSETIEEINEEEPTVLIDKNDETAEDELEELDEAFQLMIKNAATAVAKNEKEGNKGNIFNYKNRAATFHKNKGGDKKVRLKLSIKATKQSILLSQATQT